MGVRDERTGVNGQVSRTQRRGRRPMPLRRKAEERSINSLSPRAPRLAVIVFQQLTSNQPENTVVCRLGQPACKKKTKKKGPVFVEEGGGFAHSPVQKSLSFPNNNHIRSTVACNVSPLWYPIIQFTAPGTRNKMNLFVFFYRSEKNAVAHNVIHVTMAHVVFSNKDTMHCILVALSQNDAQGCFCVTYVRLDFHNSILDFSLSSGLL